jgi:phosphatidylglycerophosphatase C
MSNSQDRPVVAVFDFDGTLTKRDSFFPFLRLLAGPRVFLVGMVSCSPALLAYFLRFLPNWRAKEAFLMYFLGTLTPEQLHIPAQQFAVEVIPKLLRPEAVQRLRWHQEQEHSIVVVSASLEDYLCPWADTMGIQRVLGTRLEVKSGKYTGRIQGKNCYGPEKVERLQEYLGDLSRYCLYAYGDTKGDKDLLAAATYPYYRTFKDSNDSANNFSSSLTG